MNPQGRRSGAIARVIRLHDDDGAFDREFWARMSPARRLELAWDMVLEYLAWRSPDAGEPRLQRSVCSVERRRS